MIYTYISDCGSTDYFHLGMFMLYLFQVMTNAVDMIAKCYDKDNYKGHGSTMHKVPRDTVSTSFDAYPAANALSEREALANARLTMDVHLGAEFQLLLRHFRSSLYRAEFSKCNDPSCSICSLDPVEPSQLTELLDRFPRGMLPTPVPVLRDDGLYPVLSTLMRSNSSVCVARHGELPDPEEEEAEDINQDRVDAARDFALAHTGRYRTLFELAKTNLPQRCFFSDSHYYGKSQSFACLTCDTFVIAKSDAALKRHKKLAHKFCFDVLGGVVRENDGAE